MIAMPKANHGLGALWTFSVAARHLSFARAADELDVTAAAVSNQIRAFEQRLGTRLFWRTSRTMGLTNAGKALHAATETPLRSIDAALAAAVRASQAETLTVTASASFAAKWLVPRLSRFRERVQGVDIRIDISDHPADFARGEADVGVRFGNGDYPGLRADPLFAESVFPICSPALLHGPAPLREPNDLVHHTLIHLDWHAQDDMWPDWRMWLLAAKADKPDPARGIYFSQHSLALQAAVDGQGIALGNTSLVGDDLAAGRLVRPFDLSLKIAPRFRYYVVCLKSHAERPLIRAFREWMQEASGVSESDGRGGADADLA